MTLAGYGLSMPGPFGSVSPYIPGVVPNWGGGVSNMWSAANDMYAHNDELTFSDKVTKIAGAHGLKFGATLSRLQKQQNFQNNEEMYLVFAGPGWTPGSTGNAVGDILTGRITQMATRARSRPTANSGCGTTTSSRRTRGRSSRTSRSSTASAAATGRTTRS